MKRRLMEVAELRTGYSFRGRIERDPQGEVAVLQMKDFGPQRVIDIEGMTRISDRDVDPRQLVQEGDVIFQSRGQTFYAALVPADMPPTILASPMILIRCDRDQLDPRYATWILNEISERGEFATIAAGTAVKIINKNSLGEFEIPVPPLSVQREIATVGELARQEHVLTTEIAERRRMVISQQLIDKASRG